MAAAHPSRPAVLTVTLNPAIDRVLEVENFAVSSHLVGRRLRRYPAGKGINISRALAAMGRSSVATGFVGTGEFDAFERYLGEAKPGRILCQLLSVSGRTRENVTIIDPVAHTDTHIREQGFEASDADIRRMQSKIGLMAAGQAVIAFAGSLPPGMNVEQFQSLIHIAAARGAKVAVDVGGGLLRQLTGESDKAKNSDIWVLKPNETELAAWAGVKQFEDDAQLTDAGRRLAAHCQTLVVSRGETGAWLFNEGRCHRGRLDLDADKVVNTVGCGDCMLAGLIHARVSGDAPSQMLREALAWGAANALSEELAGLDPQTVQGLMGRVDMDSNTC